MTAAMVLCAGFGTRLRPLTDSLPKPLVPVGDRPVLAHILGALRAAGWRRVVANAHHLASDLSAWVSTRRGVDAEIDVELIREERILGTAGGLAHANVALGSGPVLVWNGDILAPEFRPTALLDVLAASGADATWLVAPRPAGEGTVGLDAGGRVVRVRGRRFGSEYSGGDFLGIQAISWRLRNTLPQEGCLVGDVAIPLLERGGQISSLQITSDWHDIGDAAGLWRANVGWLRDRRLESWVAPGIELPPEVELHECLVGEGATVSGSGQIEHCLALPGASLTAPCARRIVGRRVDVPIAPAGPPARTAPSTVPQCPHE